MLNPVGLLSDSLGTQLRRIDWKGVEQAASDANFNLVGQTKLGDRFANQADHINQIACRFVVEAMNLKHAPTPRKLAGLQAVKLVKLSRIFSVKAEDEAIELRIPVHRA